MSNYNSNDNNDDSNNNNNNNNNNKMIKWVPGISGNLVIKSKLHSRSGSSLEAVEPHQQKGAIKFF